MNTVDLADAAIRGALGIGGIYLILLACKTIWNWTLKLVSVAKSSIYKLPDHIETIARHTGKAASSASDAQKKIRAAYSEGASGSKNSRSQSAPEPLAPTHENAVDHPDQAYLDGVRSIHMLLAANQILEIPAIEVSPPASNERKISSQLIDSLDSSVNWWYEGYPRKWHVHLISPSSDPIVCLQLAITPGASAAPTGPTKLVTMQLSFPLQFSQRAVVTFKTPSECLDNLERQDCSIHAAWTQQT